MKRTQWLAPALLLLAIVALFSVAGIVARFILLVPSSSSNVPVNRDGRVRVFWPNGQLKSDVAYQEDVYHGEVRTYYESGAPYERRHYVDGHEQGVQQSWSKEGVLYLNYEVHDGRRFGLVNPSPCNVVDSAASTRAPERSDASSLVWRSRADVATPVETALNASTLSPFRRGALPYYDDATFTPRWAPGTHQVPSFSFDTQTGGTVSTSRLRGKPYVASFIYTQCAAVCPILVRQLTRVADTFTPDQAHIVSFSVTPDTDTPEALAKFGQERGVNGRKWSLATGQKRAIYTLARAGFFADDARVGDDVSDETAFLHTEKLLLVDGTGHLRGVYNGTQPFAVDQLIADLRVLTGAPTEQ